MSKEKELARAVTQYFDAEHDEEFVENFIKDVSAYGRDKKISGSRSFARLVKKMRQAQNRYFQTKSHEALKESKSLEEQVDRTVDAVLR